VDLTRFQNQLKGATSTSRPIPPVEKWDPDFCGDINLTIALDGRWFYEGSPIGRASLVQLFASVLKKENDRYFLVTPVEKVGITVEDTPFLITQWRRKTNKDTGNNVFVFTTQTGDDIELSNAEQLQLRTPPDALKDADATEIPYINVRRNLWARLHQNVYYQLLEQASEEQQAASTQFTIRSNNTRFVIGEVSI
jgi:hypothetical protein